MVVVGHELDKRLVDQLHQNRIKIENKVFKNSYGEEDDYITV